MVSLSLVSSPFVGGFGSPALRPGVLALTEGAVWHPPVAGVEELLSVRIAELS